MSSPPVNGDAKFRPDNSSEHSAQSYEYTPPLVAANEWIHNNITSDPVGKFKRYFSGLFPILSWIYRYNLTWAIGGSSADIFFLTIRYYRRYHCRGRRSTAEHVVCEGCDIASSVRSLFVICWRFYLLFLRYV